MGWEASEGGVDMRSDVNDIDWTVENLTKWDIEPICFINAMHEGQQVKKLNITVYSEFVFKYQHFCFF